MAPRLIVPYESTNTRQSKITCEKFPDVILGSATAATGVILL